MHKEQEIKKELSDILAREPIDYSKVLKLSNILASFDKDEVRFTVDAGVINRLGRELVGRHETAVSELVKNAYDADALNVSLYFENCENVGGRLKIEDNGVGMTREQLINGYMKISSSEKFHNPKSLRFERTRAGQKGIGRFAAQRIGNSLTIITQTKHSERALKVSIDWDKYTIDSDLILITNKIEEIDKQKEEGTTLFIEGVRDKWTEESIRKTYKYISELLQPFPLSSRFEESENDPGFKCYFFNNNKLIIDEESAFFQHALAEIEGYVDNEGQGFYSFSSKKLEIEQEVYLIGKKEREDKYDFLRDIHIKAYYFIYNVGLIPRKVETYIRQNAEEYGGIRLYRNGFRVLPYAEKDDDWLRLDASARRRTIVAPHGANNFYGFIEVIDTKGEIFQEQSSREGLIENQALQELKDFAYKVLTDVAIKMSHVRNRKGTAGQKEWEKKTSSEVIQEVKKDIEDLINRSNVNVPNLVEDEQVKDESFANKLVAVEQKLSQVDIINEEEKREEARIKTELLKEIQLLRILAGLGLAIGEFVHEINHYEPAFKYDAELLTSLVKTNEGKEAGQRLENNLMAFTVYTSYFREAISKNVNRELKPIELRDAVLAFIKVIKPDIIRSGIDLMQPDFIGYNLFTCPMHMSEWASILFNLYTNSKKSIKKTKKQGRILIQGGKNEKYVYLEFSDDGVGIPKENEDKIFDAFFTTSAPSGNLATEIEELTGTGLGLKIVQDIVEGYGGKIFVVEPKVEFSTTIRIEIPIEK